MRSVFSLGRRARIALTVVVALLLSGGWAGAQSVVRGKVVDSNGEAIIGASVIVPGTTTGVITDIDGNFEIRVAPGTTLEVSCIGFTTQRVSASANMSITLREDNTFLDEVVVVGYGTQRKSEITGSMARMTSEMIDERPVQNALQAMQGRVTGMDVTTNNRPGELAEIAIRGHRSLLADNSPLYVIDGIPLTAGSMADINPSDIESLEVLKDASATAIYGSRGANGVILVTTKKGKAGRTTVNYDGAFTFSKLYSTTKWMNSQELLDYNRYAAVAGDTYNGKYGSAPDPDMDISKWLNAYHASYMNASLAKVYPTDASGNYLMRAATAAEKAAGYADMVPEYRPENLINTDWGATVLRNPALTQNHVVSLSSGNDKGNVYISLGFLDQKVPMKDQGYRRYTAKVSGEVSPTKWFKLGATLNGTYGIKDYGIIQNTDNTGNKDSYSLAINKMMPWVPAYNEDGSILVVENANDQAYDNPLRNIESAKNETRSASGSISSYVELDLGNIWSPLQGLRWRTNAGAQFRSNRVGGFYDQEYTNPFRIDYGSPMSGRNNHSETLSWTLENMLMYNRTFADIHTVGLTLMQSAEAYRTESLNTYAYEMVYPTAIWYGLGNSNKSKESMSAGYSAWQRASYMARLNYSLMDKYLLTATVRYDGASVLAEGHKWDVFPSLALAWKMEQEPWIRELGWINQLKLRIGYGVTGNSAVSPYQTTGSVTSTYANQPFGVGNVSANTTGTKADVMPNLNLSWEKTASSNAGIDFAFFNYRISGSVEYYDTRTRDLLMNQTIPVITGYAQIKANVGKTANRGFEVELNTVNVQTRDFKWETNWTFSLNRERIVELANGATQDLTNNWFVGAPLRVLYTYQHAGIWQDSPADNHVMDVYRGMGIKFVPGMYKTVDQPLVEVSEGTQGAKQVTPKDINGNNLAPIWIQDNGFGTFNNDDKVFYDRSPRWTGGLNNTFTYKNWSLNIFAYLRFGNAYNGLTQTIGRRVEKDVWSPTNTNARFAKPISNSTLTGSYAVGGLTTGDIVAIRNIALYYQLPKRVLDKIGATSASVYAQVLNPFIFGGELVKAGINPDDMTGQFNRDGAFQTNNTCIARSLVLGIRFGF